MKDDVTDVEELEVPEAEEAVEANLSVTDLVGLRHIIDVASARGAFKAEEFGAIGGVYSKLKVFLDTVTAKAEEANAKEGESAEETVSEE